MFLARTRRLAIPVILTGLMACDNVTWGGVEVRLEAPPATDTAAVDSAGVPRAEPTLPPLDLGTSLFVLDRSAAPAGSTAPTPRLMPVALLGVEGLEPFPAPNEIERLGERFIRERMSPDRRFLLYADGARVGSFYPDSTRAQAVFGAPPRPMGGDPDSPEAPAVSPDVYAATLCTPRPVVGGWLELLPEASDEEHLLALPEESAPPSPPGGFQPPTVDAQLLDASLNVASALYVTREILWPPSVQAARRAMDVIRLPGESEELIVATFLSGDSLAVGPAPPQRLLPLLHRRAGNRPPLRGRLRPIPGGGRRGQERSALPSALRLGRRRAGRPAPGGLRGGRPLLRRGDSDRRRLGGGVRGRGV